MISSYHADHFIIYSKPKTLPLVAFGLKDFKDKKTGKITERCVAATCWLRSPRLP